MVVLQHCMMYTWVNSAVVVLGQDEELVLNMYPTSMRIWFQSVPRCRIYISKVNHMNTSCLKVQIKSHTLTLVRILCIVHGMTEYDAPSQKDQHPISAWDDSTWAEQILGILYVLSLSLFAIMKHVHCLPDALPLSYDWIMREIISCSCRIVDKIGS